MTNQPADSMESNAVQDLCSRQVDLGGELMHSFAKRHVPLLDSFAIML